MEHKKQFPSSFSRDILLSMKMDTKMKGHVETPIINWCNRIIHFGFYLLFALVPLLLTPWNYELFEFNKMIGVYIVTTLIVTSWIVKILLQKEIRISRTPLDIPIALFVLSQLISSIFSIDPHVSWFGYYSRFNGGMWSVISYVLLFYAYMSNRSDKTNETNMLKVALATGALVALYGVLERMGIDKDLWVQDVQNRVFSTLGQPNWLAAYLVALIPLSMGFALQSMRNLPAGKTGAKWPMLNNKTSILHLLFIIFHLALVILLFTTLLFTRSRSGLLGFVIADVIFWGLMILNFISLPAQAGPPLAKGQGSGLLTPAILIHFLFALIVFINGTGTPAIDRYVTFSGLQKIITQTKEEVAPSVKPAGPALEVGGTESGTIRKYVWQGAINAWKSSPKTFAFGTGTETFAFAFYQFRPAGHNLTSEWDFLYNKAHNEYLNYLATTGIFGLGSYIFLIGTFIMWFIKEVLISKYLSSKQFPNIKYQLGSLDQLEIRSIDFISLALFAGWLSILVTNFFGFSVVIMQVFLFMFPILIISSTLQNANAKEYTLRISSTLWMSYITLAIGAILLYVIGNYWYADTLFASGYRYNRSGLYTKALPFLSSSTKASPYEPSYHDELAQTYAGLSAEAFENKNATDAARLSTLAIRESDKALRTSPRNVNFYKTRTKVLYTLSILNPSYNNDAVTSLRTALTLSPNDPKIYYNLAILLGRQDESLEAIPNLLVAKNLKKNYRDVYYALHVFYLEAKKNADAAAILNEYLTNVDPSDADFQERLK